MEMARRLVDAAELGNPVKRLELGKSDPHRSEFQMGWT
jgi:hypothetical protein